MAKRGSMARHHNEPPLNYLVAFEAAARHLSFTQAAIELNLTQSAISRQIKRLEETLSRPLFHRHPHGIHLTPAGERYFQTVQRLLHDLDEATAELQRRGHTDQLTLATTPSISSTWLTYRLMAFLKQYPHINARILCSEHPRLLDTSEFDLGFFYHLDHRELVPGLDSQRLFADERVICVCSPDYLAEHGPIASVAELAQAHTLLVVEDHYHDWLTWADWLRHHGVADSVPKQQFRSDCYQLVLKTATLGMGVSLGWTQMLQDDLRAGRLCQPLPHSMPSYGYLAMMTPQNRYPAEPARLFTQWLLQHVHATD